MTMSVGIVALIRHLGASFQSTLAVTGTGRILTITQASFAIVQQNWPEFMQKHVCASVCVRDLV